MRPLRALGTAVTVLLCTQIALYLVNIGLIVHEVSLGERLASDVEWEQAAARSSGVAAVAFLVLLATAVVWLIWQHHAQANIAKVAVSDLRFTPGWAVGWWFIPIANLWMPFQAVRELWTESHRLGVRNGPSTWPVIWWWFLWILSNLVAGWASSMFADVNQLPEFRRAEFVELAGNALTIGAAALAITIARSITTLQEERRVRSVGAVPPPPAPGVAPSRPDSV